MPDIDRYLKVQVATEASDLHLSPGEQPVYRVSGSMVGVGEAGAKLSAEETERLLREILPERNAKELEEKADTDFGYEQADLGRFRVNVFRDRLGMGGVFRHIASKILTLEDLGMPPVLAELCELNKGLVLITGPTGCGKTTTVAAMIDRINRSRSDHIITIEDPIEFVHKSERCLIDQREVGVHATSFRRALRAALRQDPDIVMIGEMRDLETTETAITTAETGHLVIGTLHTTTASSSIDRIIGQFPAERQEQIRSMLSQSLAAVISQTLLRRPGGGGRVAALEILIGTPAVANQIREAKTHQLPSAMQVGQRHGMRLLNDDLQRLVREGAADPKDAYYKAVDKPDMANRLRAMGHEVGSL